MDQIAFVALAKNPALESFKTRLLDTTQSLQIVKKTYELLLKITDQALQESAQQDLGIRAFWSINSEIGLKPDFFSDEIQVMPQGTGGLGNRLDYIYSTLKNTHNSVIIVGSDLPLLSCELIKQCVDQLKKTEVVIGPSEDGGFYLFAARIPLELSFWSQVEYSRPTTLDQLLRQLALKSVSVSYLSTLTDIDDFSSYQNSVQSMLEVPHLSGQQKELITYFLDEVEPNQMRLESVAKAQAFLNKAL